MLQAYNRFLTIQGNPIGDDWLSVTGAAFDEFRASGHATMPTSTPPPNRTSTNMVTPLELFRKGIKRDSGAFSPLKDMKQWDQYKRSTLAQAKAQDVADVLNPAYSPVTQDAKDLFAVKQTFMYAVFEKTLFTDYGKSVVRAHEKDSDAQKVFAEIMEYADTQQPPL